VQPDRDGEHRPRVTGQDDGDVPGRRRVFGCRSLSVTVRGHAELTGSRRRTSPPFGPDRTLPSEQIGRRYPADTRSRRTAGRGREVRHSGAMRAPQTQYATSGDVYIVYQVTGDGPIDIALDVQWFSQMDGQWEVPPLARFLRRLAAFSRLVVFRQARHRTFRPGPDQRPAVAGAVDGRAAGRARRSRGRACGTGRRKRRSFAEPISQTGVSPVLRRSGCRASSRGACAASPPRRGETSSPR
jgi:hypothetical protein